MQTTFNVSFVLDNQQGAAGYARLTVDLPFAPTMGVSYEHPVWDDPQKPVFVGYNLDDDTFYVDFGVYKFSNRESRDDEAKMFRGHGWTVED